MNKEIISITKKSIKKQKDDITSEKSRIMRRTARYRINEENTRDKKIKACNNESIKIKIEK